MCIRDRGSALQACAVNDNVTYAALGLEEDENLLIQDGFVVDKTTGVIRQYIGDVKELTIPAEIGGVTITGIDPYALTGKDFTYINLQIPLTELPNNLFAGLGNLASITLPETITSVGESAFENCASLLNITFGANSKLTSIGDYAFSGCVKLTGIDLPDTLETIGYRAFYQTAFVSLGLPASIQSIGDYAFMNMTSLQTMDLSSVSADASLGLSLIHI